MHWLAHLFGIDNLSGPWYGFWSGIGGDTAIVTPALILARRHNCHVKGCPRIGRHKVAGTEFVVCRKHHPDDHPTVQDVHQAHREAAS